MKRFEWKASLPDEDPLQDAVWEDESPAPVPAPERMHPARDDTVELRHLWMRAVAFRTQWLLLQMFGPAQQDDAHDPIARLKRKYGRQ